MDIGVLAFCVFIVGCNIYELKEHNKKVNNYWPDDSDQQHWNMRHRFTIGLGGEYFLLVILV